MEGLFSPEGFANGAGPLYLQLQRRIADAMARGVLAPGSSLPAERDIAAMTGLSRVTVRKAIEALVAQGMLVQRRGSGTFVAPRLERLEQALSLLTSFTEDMARPLAWARGTAWRGWRGCGARMACRWPSNAPRFRQPFFPSRRLWKPLFTPC